MKEQISGPERSLGVSYIGFFAQRDTGVSEN